MLLIQKGKPGRVLQKECPTPSCHNLTNGGKCRACLSVIRGTTAERGYGSDWQRLQKIKLNQDAVCEIRTHCDGALATEVDHHVPIRVRPDLRLQLSNLVSSCKPCHSAKTMSEVMPGKRDRESAHDV